MASRFARTSTTTSTGTVGLGAEIGEQGERATGDGQAQQEDADAQELVPDRSSRPRTPKVSRRLAAVFATAVIASARKFAACAPAPIRSRKNSTR